MTVEHPDMIDFVAHDPARDEAMLVMVEQRLWADRGALLPDLQAKFNTYLAYVTTGRLSADFPDLAGQALHFQLRASYAPSDRELEFLRVVRDQHLAPAGIRLSWKVIDQDGEYGI
jgi:hypothetical protein